MITVRRATGLLAAALLLTLPACSGSTRGGAGSGGASTAAPSGSGSSTGAPSGRTTAPSSDAPTTGSTPTGIAPTGRYYVSVGDSYAAGYQATGRGTGATTRNGFAYQVVDRARAEGYRFTLVNFGCGGATTASILHSPGCAPRNLGPGAAPYGPRTQVAAAAGFLRAHRGQVALVTVSIGGNDVIACGASGNAVGCLTSALTAVKANLAAALRQLRAAAGPTTRIVGITYPDVLLGNELSPDATLKGTAELSVFAFRSLINPALQAAYQAVGGSFVDVTAATGAYGPLTATTTLAPYGTIPVPVAQVCRLTYFCQYQDIHPRTGGYAIIANLVVGTLPKR